MTKNTEEHEIPYKSTTTTLNDLLARFDPAKHTHELLLDGEPMGQETI